MVANTLDLDALLERTEWLDPAVFLQFTTRKRKGPKVRVFEGHDSVLLAKLRLADPRRRKEEDEELERFIQGAAADGAIIEPIYYMGDFEVVNGRRRVLAAHALGLKKIPARRVLDDVKPLELLRLAYAHHGERKTGYGVEELLILIPERFGWDFINKDLRVMNWQNFTSRDPETITGGKGGIVATAFGCHLSTAKEALSKLRKTPASLAGPPEMSDAEIVTVLKNLRRLKTLEEEKIAPLRQRLSDLQAERGELVKTALKPYQKGFENSDEWIAELAKHVLKQADKRGLK